MRLIALAVAVLIGWYGTIGRQAYAIAPAIAADILVGVGSQALIEHLERCRALPPARKGALTAGVNIMRRTPTGWGKAFVAVSVIAAAWAYARDQYGERLGAAYDAWPGLEGEFTAVLSGDVYRVSVPAGTKPMYQLEWTTPKGVVNYLMGHYEQVNTATVPPGSRLRQRHSYNGGWEWSGWSDLGTLPYPRPPQGAPDTWPGYDGMTADPGWQADFRDALREELGMPTAVAEGYTAPNTPHLYQRPGTDGTQPGDWVMDEPDPWDEYHSPETAGDPGIGESPSFDPAPEPSPDPSGEPSVEPSTNPSPTPTPDLPPQPVAENWWLYLWRALGTKFPFDLIADVSAMPTFADQDVAITTFGQRWDLNFVKPWVLAAKWISIIVLVVSAVLLL